MNKTVDPGTFGLPPGTQIELTLKDSYVLVIQRKSRIVMKDGRSILARVAKIKSSVPAAQVEVQTSAPVCSKTRRFLQEHSIAIGAIE